MTNTTLGDPRGRCVSGKSAGLHLRDRRCAPTVLWRKVLQRIVKLTSHVASCGKGLSRQPTALHLRGLRCAPTSLALQAAPALASSPLARRSRSTGSPASGLACSVLQPAAELTSFTAFAAFRQSRRDSLRSALTRAAASPVLPGAPQARRGLSGHAFACWFVVRNERDEPSRQAVPAGGDLWSDEDRRPGVGARSALRRLTRRNYPSAANAASSATRPSERGRPKFRPAPIGVAASGKARTRRVAGPRNERATPPGAANRVGPSGGARLEAHAALRHLPGPATARAARRALPGPQCVPRADLNFGRPRSQPRTAVQSARSADRGTMSRRRVPPGATRKRSG